MLKAPMLLAAVLVVCVASSADARRRHHGYYGERTPSTLDDRRRGRATQDNAQDNAQDQGQDQAQDLKQDLKQDPKQDQNQDRAQVRGQDRFRERYDRRRARDRDREGWARRREAERGDAALRPGRGGPFAAVVDKLVRICSRHGTDFDNWPFDALERIAGADEGRRNALAALRERAKTAAERLAADCPQDVPAAPAARLEAVEQGIDTTLAAFDTVGPALQSYYGALDDEQKARLYRDMMVAPAAAATRETTGRREAVARAGAPRQAAVPGWGATMAL
jgi:hypothetical protein